MMQMKNSHPFYRTHRSTGEPGYYRVPSKVVSIPVHFVGSERSRIESAIKIQRMLRGFLVRNAMKKIGAMRVELERIESGIRVEVLRREEKERVRVIETIMNLLLRLDSVRVLHYSGLRECRKSVIKKAIAVQEMLDEMSVLGSEDCLVKEEECNAMDEEGKEGEITCEEQKEEEKIEALRNEDDEEGKSLVKGDCETEEGDEKKKKKKEMLLEKLVEDNQKMMEMMTQLFQRNETETTLLNSLSQRVEQIERAFVSEKLRSKKKKSKAKQTRPKNGFH